MKISFRELLFIGVFTAGSLTAHSAIITDLSARDWRTSGDGLLTYDASTGLEWLDLTVTAGNSILDTEAESFFLSGEFTWASNSQIESLLDAAVGGVGRRVSRSAPDVANTHAFISLLGETYVDRGYRLTNGVSRLSRVSSDSPLYHMAYADVQGVSGPAMVVDPWPDTHCLCFTERTQEPWNGSWLVRAAPPTLVPEPATLSLLGLGLAGLGFVRKQTRS